MVSALVEERMGAAPSWTVSMLMDGEATAREARKKTPATFMMKQVGG
jgi:hypothetical protein